MHGTTTLVPAKLDRPTSFLLSPRLDFGALKTVRLKDATMPWLDDTGLILIALGPTYGPFLYTWVSLGLYPTGADEDNTAIICPAP